MLIIQGSGQVRSNPCSRDMELAQCLALALSCSFTKHMLVQDSCAHPPLVRQPLRYLLCRTLTWSRVICLQFDYPCSHAASRSSFLSLLIMSNVPVCHGKVVVIKCPDADELAGSLYVAACIVNGSSWMETAAFAIASCTIHCNVDLPLQKG